MLVIFDFDGVLTNSEELALERELEFFKNNGLDFGRDYYQTFASGLTREDFIDRLEQEYQTRHRTGLPDSFIPELEKLHALVIAALQPIEGVRETLQLLRQHQIPFCIASNSGLQNLHYKLKIIGLDHEFLPQHVFSKDMIAPLKGKPLPFLFEYAAKQMGFRPDQCIVVEDSVPGVTAGVAAGMRVIGHCGGAHRPAQYDRILKKIGAAATIADMKSLPDLLRSWLGLAPFLTPKAPAPI